VWLERHLTERERAAERAADVQATLCAFTARTIALAVNSITASSLTNDVARGADNGIREAFVCGGGAHNLYLMELLAREVPHISWNTTDALGVPADWVEAVAFAWLAWRLIDRRPGNIASVTGASGERVLGAIYPA
jgi:anhydro-N-acetylmuramic acid kinase